MTTTGEIDTSRVTEAPADMSPPARRDPRALRALLPWVFPAVAALAALLGSDTPAREVALYAAYLLLAVVTPGTLVFRGLFGSRGNWPEDLGLGAATGLVVMLAGWALGAATGLQHLLILWPVLVVLPFLAVPRLRRHWRRGPGDPLPLRWSWAMAATLVAITGWAATVFATPLPPVTHEYYPDLYYHLALVHEMMRSMPFQVPQLAGDTLRYHYLSDADIATASMVTGIAPTTVLLRLWLIPIVSIAAVVYAVLARALTGRWWAGPLAATVAFAGQALSLGSAVPTFSAPVPVTVNSPSQTFAVPLIGLFVVLAVDRLRGRPLGWGWAFLPVLAVACAGSKASVLPPVAAGLALTGAVTLCRRRPPWAAAGLLAVTGFGMAAGLRLFAGGGAGTLQPQALSLLGWIEPYRDTLGAGDGVVRNGLVPLGVEQAGTAGRWFVAWVVLWALLLQAPRLGGLLRPRGATRTDPAFPLLAGIVVAGTGAAWALWHPSASQLYFFAAAAPFGAVLLAWSLADRVRGWRAPVAGLIAGALGELLLPAVHVPARETIGNWAWTLAVPVLRVAALTVAAILVVVLLWRRRGARAVPVALLAAVAGASIAGGVRWTTETLADPPVKTSNKGVAVRAPEMAAALWLDANAGRDDVVATNVHCMPMRVKVCNARAFWVAGLGGRRTLVESWAYSDETVAANGRDGLKYFYQPAPEPGVYQLNERVFSRADPADVARLRDDYRVRWLFADTRAGAVSPRLADVARLRYQRGTVTVYEVR
ncbi:hypothetical protein [Actinoplanes teichomyceticus]|uniref:4-amino-4-deoxy-L-arabinose transferase-like glycosyltransferase n=1 Tax=Actinoplanes teichomyceticus TaxID=1867 RepID=A0A561WSJ4_ACTTI|nr:hypothetical protein [Actinoplanes teichomyceticus]TWG26839.1 hypothetical protein FHX34_1011839 [Actinoplanes teichomyceticus]GIF15238.1 hypothetical protein Ate01nite_52700 [Actinoplanes teichomyceticus]